MEYFQFRRNVFPCVLIILSVDLDVITAYKLCTSDPCRRAGDNIIRSIDTAISPCNDFYHHVCGNWMSSFSAPTAQDDYLEQKKTDKLLEAMYWPLGPLGSTTCEKVINYFKTCDDLAAIDAKGFRPLEKIVEDNGGWPLIISDDDWHRVKSEFTINKIHKNYFKNAGVSALFHFDVHPDPSRNGRYILYLLPPKHLSASSSKHEYRFANGGTEERRKRAESVFIKKVANLLAQSRGFEMPIPQLTSSKVSKMLNFKASLMNFYQYDLDAKSKNGNNYRVVTISWLQTKWNELISQYPEFWIDWLEAVRSAFEETDIEIDETEKIAIAPKQFIARLAEAMIDSGWGSVANYVHWVAISDLLPYTNKTMRSLVNDYVKDPYNLENIDDRRQYTCLEEHGMADGLAHVYAGYNFPNDMKNNVSVIVTEMREKMKEKIEGSPWVDFRVKKEYKDRLDRLTTSIGYPKWFENTTEVDEYFENLKVSQYDYFENVINSRKFYSTLYLTELRKPYDEKRAESSYVLNGLDAMNFHQPFYHHKRPMVMKFGVIGSQLGPAMIESFLNEGKFLLTTTMVLDGTRRWLDPMIARFSDKLKWIAERQVERLNLIGSKNYKDVNNTDAMANIIANVVGFTVAFEAYKSFKEKNHLEDIREQPLSIYSEEQLFFYAAVNRLCEADIADSSNSRVRMYGPNAEIINVALAMSEEFPKAFECSPGSPMNLKEKQPFFDSN